MTNNDTRCPECDGPMILRTNRKTHEQFYGCTFYPECTGTREAEDENDEGLTLRSEQALRNDRMRWRDE